MKVRWTLTVDRKLAEKELKKGAIIQHNGARFEIKGGIEEIEKSYPDFEIYYLTQFMKVKKEA